MALATKIINVKLKKNAIQTIIDEGDIELLTVRTAEGKQIVKRWVTVIVFMRNLKIQTL